MLRKYCLLLTVLLTVPLSIWAQGKLPDGTYRLAMINSAHTEQNLALVKIVTADGKQSGTLLAVPPRNTVTLKDFKSNETGVTIALSTGLTFTSATQVNDKVFLGSFSNDNFAYRGKLALTEKSTLEQADVVVRVNVPTELTQAMTLNSKPMMLRMQSQQSKDADKKKDLLDQLPAAQKEADEKVPALLREVINKHTDTMAALDASNLLITMASKVKLSSEEAGQLVKIIQKQAAPYGAAYTRSISMQTATTLLRQKGMEALAVELLEPLYRGLNEKMPASQQQPVLANYAQALKAVNKTELLKSVEARLDRLEAQLDQEYLASVPPFKPTKFAGRKEGEANQVAVLELFTGAQCPPCVAADVAFDALEKAYDHKDLVLIQYHMHIPGPDPLTNPSTVARFDYYKKLFPGEMRGTPSTLFNGKPEAGGGGGMANAEVKYGQYTKLINPTLDKSTPVKVSGTASRTGDKLDIQVDVYGVEGDDKLKLRVLIVEETIKYVGSNKLRFHHQVVRDMPGGVDGIEVSNKNFKHQLNADVGKIRADLTKYLDDYAVNRPFPNSNRPLDMKSLKVIALVQNDKTGAIVQACQLDVGNKIAAK